MSGRTLWIVGKLTDRGPWEFCGVFDSEEAACAECAGPKFFIGPVELNRRTPEETVEWPGARYPRALQRP